MKTAKRSPSAICLASGPCAALAALFNLAVPAFADFVINGESLFRMPPETVRTYPLAPPSGEALTSPVYRLPSPDGRFMAEIWGDGESPVRWAVLRYPDGNGLVLGDSERGIDMRWWPTQIGPLLSLQNQQDTHFNESFVIRPVGETPGDGYEVLYSTVRTALPHLEHSYTEIRNVSPDGILSLRHTWDYAPAQGNPGSGEWTIPLFLGYTRSPYAEGAESDSHAEFAESTELNFHAESAESAECGITHSK